MNYHVTYLYRGKVCLQGTMTAALALALADHIEDVLGGNAERNAFQAEKDDFHDWITSYPSCGQEYVLIARGVDDSAYMMKVTRL